MNKKRIEELEKRISFLEDEKNNPYIGEFFSFYKGVNNEIYAEWHKFRIRDMIECVDNKVKILSEVPSYGFNSWNKQKNFFPYWVDRANIIYYNELSKEKEKIEKRIKEKK